MWDLTKKKDLRVDTMQKAVYPYAVEDTMPQRLMQVYNAYSGSATEDIQRETRMCITNARCMPTTLRFMWVNWGTDFSFAVHEHSWKSQQFKNELRKWKRLPPLYFIGTAVIINEGKPGRPPGLQPRGCPEPTPGDAADTKQNRLLDDGHDEFDVVYSPSTQTNLRQSEVYDLLKVY